MEYTERLKTCFLINFDEWIWHSNDSIIQDTKHNVVFGNKGDTKFSLDVTLPNRKEEVLNQILDILIREPNADYFWFHYDGRLTYTLPADYVQAVPGDAIRVDKAKIKSLIRDIKLKELGI